MHNKLPLALVLLLGVGSTGILLAQTCLEETTKCITEPTGGDCASIGSWDAASKTCTLTADLTGEAIQIAGDGVTLNGGGHSLTSMYVNGTMQPFGVYAEQRTGVTVRNLTVEQFQAGIVLLRCSGGKVTGNTLHDSARVGIELFESSNNVIGDNILSTAGDGIIVNQSTGNTLRGNRAESNRDSGIILKTRSSGNTLTGNISRLNSGGITLGGDSNHNTISDNDVSGNRHLGVALYFAANENVLIGNRIAGNAVGVTNGAGVLIMESSGNRLSNNTVAGNSRGIWIAYPDTTTFPGGGNEAYNNKIVDNETQALVTGRRSIPDKFSKQAPIGGNFWGNWTTPDANRDGFVDAPYVFSGGGDTLPWRAKDGWAFASR